MKPITQMAIDSISNTKSKAELLSSNAKQDMVEMGGRISQVLGFPRSTGQIFGLLYFSSIPLSLGDICDMLGISKASTSTGTRQLAAWGAIRKVWIPGERRDYYEAVDDLVQLFNGSYRTLIKPRIKSSNNRIRKIEDSLKVDLHMQLITKEQQEFMSERLGKIKKIYSRMSKVLPLFERLLS